MTFVFLVYNPRSIWNQTQMLTAQLTALYFNTTLCEIFEPSMAQLDLLRSNFYTIFYKIITIFEERLE
jgi:hypothetical protein